MNMNVALMGDFNCRIDCGNDNRGQEHIGFLSEFSMICLNEKDTYTYTVHNGQSTIDLVFLKTFPKGTTISIGLISGRFTEFLIQPTHGLPLLMGLTPYSECYVTTSILLVW